MQWKLGVGTISLTTKKCSQYCIMCYLFVPLLFVKLCMPKRLVFIPNIRFGLHHYIKECYILIVVEDNIHILLCAKSNIRYPIYFFGNLQTHCFIFKMCTCWSIKIVSTEIYAHIFDRTKSDERVFIMNRADAYSRAQWGTMGVNMQQCMHSRDHRLYWCHSNFLLSVKIGLKLIYSWKGWTQTMRRPFCLFKFQ